jgi:hypothetical protein
LNSLRRKSRLEGVEEPVEALRIVCRQALKHFRRSGHLFRVLHHEKALRCAKGRKELGRRREELRGFARHVLLDGVRKRVFAARDVDFASSMLWGMMRSAVRNHGDVRAGELADRVVELFVKGITARR